MRASRSPPSLQPSARSSAMGHGWLARVPRGLSLNGRRLLIVEDEVFVAMDIAFTCEVAGAEVTGTTTVRSALDAIGEADLENRPFDAALLDLAVRDGTTERVADALRKRRVPFLVYTGEARDGNGLAEQFGVRILAKPMPVEEIALGIAGLLKGVGTDAARTADAPSASPG